MKMRGQLWWTMLAVLSVAISWAACTTDPPGLYHVDDVGLDAAQDTEFDVPIDTIDIIADIATDTGRCNGGPINACGGCEVLVEELDEPCGPCGLDLVVCDGPEATRCSGDTACDSPGVHTLEVSDLAAFSVVLHGELVSPGTKPPTAHGFCVSTIHQEPDLEDEEESTTCSDFGALTEPATFSETLETASSTTYFARAYATNEFATTYGVTVEFLTLPDSPTEVEATTDADDVTVSWAEVAGATGYQIKIGDGDWIDVEDGATSYIDATAPTPTLTSATVEASDGTRADAVVLSLSSGGEIIEA
ncbi:MAG: hypothetical protein ACNA8W_21375, partial [Bradymonadaceae bacterium]